MMKALQIIKEDTKVSLNLVEIPKPKIKRGYAVVRVKASAINPSDVLNSQGGFPTTTFPRVPGRDFAGIVEEGAAAWVGKRVYGTSGGAFSFTQDGAHAEYCRVREDGLVEIPENLTFGQAASIGVPFTTASLAISKTNPTSSGAIMVLGANGAVGSAAVQLAERSGFQVIKVARDASADINSRTDPQLEGAKSMKGRFDFDLVADVVIDTVGDANLTTAAIAVMGFGGRYSFISAPRGANGPIVPLDFLSLYRREISLYGSNTATHTQAFFAEKLRGMNDGFKIGTLKTVQESSLTNVSLQGALGRYGERGNRMMIRME